ncbi:hypothetical protein [Halorubrum sp. AJ67]|uniref:hypothetical protein n=1 Tax=Halorubrum sp. AJ67 TaxID=1173487 RepID=UPI000B2D0B17|nr:hypothetical protein [Halorubrum sp. AJ67]
MALPIVDRLADGDYDETVDAIDEHTSIDVSSAVDKLSEKTGLPLNTRTFVGVIDVPPSEVREEFQSIPRWWPCWLASIQYEMRDEQRVYEVGSYAFRSEGLLNPRQVHVRLTPREGTRRQHCGRTRSGRPGDGRWRTTAVRRGRRSTGCDTWRRRS